MLWTHRKKPGTEMQKKINKGRRVLIRAVKTEIAPTKDAKKLVEIANDENDHSQIYQGLLNKING